MYVILTEIQPEIGHLMIIYKYIEKNITLVALQGFNFIIGASLFFICLYIHAGRGSSYAHSWTVFEVQTSKFKTLTLLLFNITVNGLL